MSENSKIKIKPIQRKKLKSYALVNKLPSNVAVTFGMKDKNPFTGEWNYDNPHLLPAVYKSAGAFNNQKYNYIIITCEPCHNGVYRYPVELTSTFKIWYNGNLACYYVPLEVCEKIKELHELDGLYLETVKEFQFEWVHGCVKNNNHVYEYKPDWALYDQNY